jgi:hypothetical protein
MNLVQPLAIAGILIAIVLAVSGFAGSSTSSRTP